MALKVLLALALLGADGLAPSVTRPGMAGFAPRSPAAARKARSSGMVQMKGADSNRLGAAVAVYLRGIK